MASHSISNVHAGRTQWWRKSTSDVRAITLAMQVLYLFTSVYLIFRTPNPQLIKNKNLTLRLMLRAGKISRADYYAALNQRIALR